MELIDKSAVVAEIERRIKINKECMLCLRNLDYYQGKIDALNDTISFLDTLEVKEVSWEEKAAQLSQKYFPDKENIWARSNIEAHKCKSACIEMVEWFKAQKGE
jgi:hypothetical protein